MALQIIGTDTIGSGIQVDLGTSGDGIIAEGVIVGSTNHNAVVGTGDGQTVRVNGDVHGAISGVRLGDTLNDSGQKVIVGADGFVGGLLQGIYIAGNDTRVENDGEIWSDIRGIYYGGGDANTIGTIINRGLISAPVAIARLAGSSSILELVNDGTIRGLTNSAFNAMGGAGRDMLIGGADKDIFVFNAGLAATNRDVVTDFKAADDVIHLQNAVFKALTKTGTLAASMFKLGSAATDADDRIVYNKATGALSYDADGEGGAAQIQFATLQNKAAISHFDFVVI